MPAWIFLEPEMLFRPSLLLLSETQGNPESLPVLGFVIPLRYLIEDQR